MNILTAVKTQRKLYGILLFSIIVFLTALIYFFLPEGKELSFESVHDNVLPENTKPGMFVVKSEGEWKNMWQSVAGKTPKEESGVDFSKSEVMAVFAGTKNTSGYSVLVKKVLETDKQVKVVVEEESPGKNCFYAQALSNPYHIIKFAKTSKQVVSRKSMVKKDCNGS